MKMKKLLLSLSLIFMAAGATLAQEQGSIRIGAGLVYGTKAGINDEGDSKGGIGINIGGEYFFTDKISAAPSLTYFLKSESEVTTGFGTYKSSVQFTSINIDGRYYFGEGDIAFYGLAGLSIASVKIDSNSDFGGSGSASETGVNLGAGLIYPINDQLGLNGQIKYNTPLEQLAIQAGISYTIK
ncbi:porin family protein [Pontibacter sp. Tf4]|uniref:outer membrane beta-barrel protein n=1 Tax=Pontibacter sp. Tf4 TaxID=2761620 RepID=UPI001629B04B|nr:outer membrane beta-barrel protein [Pontibacter sp. Tf4]MBB6610768.1 porin family protein [Pontibacter sp. Tf4]